MKIGIGGTFGILADNWEGLLEKLKLRSRHVYGQGRRTPFDIRHNGKTYKAGSYLLSEYLCGSIKVITQNQEQIVIESD